MAKNNSERDFDYVPIDDYFKSEDYSEGEDDLERKLEEQPKDHIKTDKEGFLKDILMDKIKFLRDILDDIEFQMKDREKLKDNIMYKFDKGICYLRTKIYELEIWGLGNNKDIDSRRSKLEKELENLKLQKRVETRESWRDTALLKKEQREFFHEYSNAMRRVKMIFPEEEKKNDSDDSTK